MESIASVPDAAKKRLEFHYDHQNRRVCKKIFSWNGSAFQCDSKIKLVWDGWNCIAELNGNNRPLRSYAWGLDLSGSLQGAGGVGGLLMMNDHNSGTSHFYSADGNGNVAALINTDTGVVSATYEFSPFGELLRATGLMAKINPYRFSTRYTDQESGIIFWPLRPGKDGRFLSRDPIEEQGGLNLYAFSKNDMVNFFDPLGSALWTVEGDLKQPQLEESIKELDAIKKDLKKLIDANVADGLLDQMTFYWYDEKGNKEKLGVGAVGHTKFMERFDHEVIVRSEKGNFNKLALDIETIKAPIKNHKYSYDITAYTHHAIPLTQEWKVYYGYEVKTLKQVKEAVSAIAVEKGKLLHVTCEKGKQKGLDAVKIRPAKVQKNKEGDCDVEWGALTVDSYSKIDTD